MLLRRPRGWELKESLVTPEHLALSRRKVLAGGAAIAGGLIAGAGIPRASWLFGGPDEAAVMKTIEAVKSDPSFPLYPVKQNPAFATAGREVTPEVMNAAYNNFYEFGSSKQVYEPAQRLNFRPWTVRIDGLVEKPFELGIDDLLKEMPLEERIVRHRCVEAWSMVVPWSGFALRALVERAKPLGSAKFVRFETFLDKEVAPGQGYGFGYPWPYVEGLTIPEATNELAFMVTGAYGKPLAKQFGAPIRLHTPWKYGFKSIKSVVKVSFTEERPKSFWEVLGPSEYGFWANVNPEVSHPRWSQATERVLGTDERVETVLYNGYGEWVAGLYQGLESERLFM
jgi:sulfoxide reductase catalytic subunit YedY